MRLVHIPIDEKRQIQMTDVHQRRKSANVTIEECIDAIYPSFANTEADKELIELFAPIKVGSFKDWSSLLRKLKIKNVRSMSDIEYILRCYACGEPQLHLNLMTKYPTYFCKNCKCESTNGNSALTMLAFMLPDKSIDDIKLLLREFAPPKAKTKGKV